MAKDKRTRNAWPFGADFGRQASSDRTLSGMRLVEQRLFTALDTATRQRASFRRNWTTWTWPMRRFNETTPRAARPTKRFDCRTRRFLLACSLVSVIGIGPPGSCHLTPFHFFLRGYSKRNVHVDEPTTARASRDEIKRRIRRNSATITRKGEEKFGRKGACVPGCVIP